MHHSGSRVEPDTWEHRQSSFAQVPTTHWAFDIGFMHTSLVISTTALTLTGSNLASRSTYVSWTFAGIIGNMLPFIGCNVLLFNWFGVGSISGQSLVQFWDLADIFESEGSVTKPFHYFTFPLYMSPIKPLTGLG